MLKLVIVAVLVAVATAQGYGHLRRTYAPVAVHATPRRHGYASDYAQPTPYNFGYDIKDDYNGGSSRQESGDGYGNVKGSYGYTDGNGIYRQVEYTADDYGYRASIKTNEPGTDNQSPADVNIYADPIQVKTYAPRRSYAPVHRAVSYAPVHRATSYAPVHRATSYAPVHRATSYAPVHRATSYAPVHRATSYAPVHRAIVAAPSYGYAGARRYA